MADLSAVEGALVAIIGAALYPSAYTPGSYATSNTGATVKLYRGWPESATLNADLVAGKAHVSVFSDPGMTRDVSRWPAEPVQVATVSPTVTLSLSGAVVTLGGTITAGNVAGVQAGAPVAAYAYIIQAGDTLTTAAAALAAKFPGATSSGPTITLPSALNASVGVMVPQPVYTITRQQVQGVRISIWAPDPLARDAIVGLIDNGIAGIKNAGGALTKFFSIGSYESARIQYRTTYTSDVPARDRVWRRDLCYNVEYPTTLIEQDPIMLFGIENVWTQGVLNSFGGVEPSVSVLTDNSSGYVFVDAAGNIIGSQPTS